MLLRPLARLVVVAMLGVGWLVAPSIHAAGDRAPEARTPAELLQEQLLLVTVTSDPAAVHVAPSEQDDDPAATEPFLERLLAEINLRRERAGTGRLVYVAGRANEAVGAYLADLTPAMDAAGSCFHGGRSGSDYVATVGFTGDAGGEVIACPADDGYWTAERIAETWWSSPLHQRILYRDAGARALACGAYGPQRGGSAYRTIACVTYRG